MIPGEEQMLDPLLCNLERILHQSTQEHLGAQQFRLSQVVFEGVVR
jgi:hypothetical protein